MEPGNKANARSQNEMFFFLTTKISQSTVAINHLSLQCTVAGYQWPSTPSLLSPCTELAWHRRWPGEKRPDSEFSQSYLLPNSEQIRKPGLNAIHAWWLDNAVSSLLFLLRWLSNNQMLHSNLTVYILLYFLVILRLLYRILEGVHEHSCATYF